MPIMNCIEVVFHICALPAPADDRRCALASLRSTIIFRDQLLVLLVGLQCGYQLDNLRRA